ncbi:MAG TPA: hypothetical protein VKT73_15200 [Xanthobacteraceae bacterium]|nr:hypothetical protein [Xanthobacteraceae bacterium]
MNITTITWILRLASPFIGGSIFGLPVAAIVSFLTANSTEITMAATVIQNVAKKLAAAKGISIQSALAEAAQMVAKVHPMVPGSIEEKIWMERQSLPVNGG